MSQRALEVRSFIIGFLAAIVLAFVTAAAMDHSAEYEPQFEGFMQPQENGAGGLFVLDSRTGDTMYINPRHADMKVIKFAEVRDRPSPSPR